MPLGPPPPPPNPPGPKPPPGPPRPPRGGPPPGGGPPSALPEDSSFGPMPNDRLKRRFTATDAGLFPSLIGSSVSPLSGWTSRQPNDVGIYRPLVASLVQSELSATPGRSLMKLSPVRSRPVTTLYGRPVCATMNGLKRRFHGAV